MPFRNLQAFRCIPAYAFADCTLYRVFCQIPYSEIFSITGLPFTKYNLRKHTPECNGTLAGYGKAYIFYEILSCPHGGTDHL